MVTLTDITESLNQELIHAIQHKEEAIQKADLTINRFKNALSLIKDIFPGKYYHIKTNDWGSCIAKVINLKNLGLDLELPLAVEFAKSKISIQMAYYSMESITEININTDLPLFLFYEYKSEEFNNLLKGQQQNV